MRSREDSQVVQRIIEALSSGVGLPEELEGQLTAEVLARIELQLLKAVMATGQLKVRLDYVMMTYNCTSVLTKTSCAG